MLNFSILCIHRGYIVNYSLFDNYWIQQWIQYSIIRLDDRQDNLVPLLRDDVSTKVTRDIIKIKNQEIKKVWGVGSFKTFLRRNYYLNK